jgi:hypothetical protein
MSRTIQQMRADNERYRRMLEAGTGVNFPGASEPPSPEVEAARTAIMKVFPELGELLKLAEHAPHLIQMRQQWPTVSGSHEQLWERYGHQTLENIAGSLAKDLGVENLSNFQRAAMGNAFISWLQSEPQLADRYRRGDTRLADEFLTEYRSNFFDPVRRMSQGGAPAPGGGRPLPPAPRPGGGPPPPAAPPNPGTLTEDQVHDGAWNSFVAATGGRR